MKFAFYLPLTLLLFSSASAQLACPPGDAARTAILPLGIQYKLLNHKIAPDDIEMDAPKDVERDIITFRKTLDVATQAFFRCEVNDNEPPSSIGTKLAVFLHADRSVRTQNDSTSDGIYGANLKVHVESAKDFRNSIFVVLNFGIECGDDNLLFLYTKKDGHWHQQLHWYSDKFAKPSDAFGDLYLYSAVPGQEGAPLLAIVHGHPWCTSRWSGFEVDLIRPATQPAQATLGHFSTGYDRASDEKETLHPTSDGFTFTFWTNEAVPEKDSTAMSGPLTIRFKTTANALQCISKGCPKQSAP